MTCFVIQPFDKGIFDKRNAELFAPAIRAAGLTPYRVDQDPGVYIPIQTIHEKISASQICLAEITTNNPNVWYELGFAIATGKQVVILSNQIERQGRFPFDIQHLLVVKYDDSTEEGRAALMQEISSRIKARAGLRGMVAAGNGAHVPAIDHAARFAEQLRFLGENSDKDLIDIRSRAHWQVVIRPTVFQEARFGMKALRSMMKRNAFRFYGWQYPYFKDDEPEYGVDWLGGRCKPFGGHHEYWRIFQSGQFAHVFSFVEDEDKEKADEIAPRLIPGMNAFKPSGYVDVPSIFQRTTLVFELAKRLVQYDEFGNGVQIEIGMMGIQNRILFVFNQSRYWHSFYKCSAENLPFRQSVTKEELTSNAPQLALDCAEWFYERFGWHDAPSSTFATEQQELLRNVR